ncbi:hypothetical protein AB2L27_08190 [Kineococcus sp. LSe6-4]|uniref:Uncharacterized protein n=1 Tax=Kineococcus halophytocola TaxID=3234027 RepID=A0ABV4GZK0_9ACTN
MNDIPGLSRSAFGSTSFGGAEESDRLITSADNLLGKASRALEAGDEEKARRLVERAMALPVDEHEGVHPAWWSSHMALHTLVVDAIEESEENDHRWLSAAEAVLSGDDGPGAVSLRGTLGSAGESVGLTPHEARRCTELGAGHSEDDRWDAPASEITAAAVLDVLRVAQTYREQLTAS